MNERKQRRSLMPLLFVAVGLFIGFSLSTSDLSPLRMVAAIGAIFATGLAGLVLSYPRSYERLMRTGDGPTPCPRCDARPRTGAWCEPCSAELNAASLSPPAAVSRFDRAAVAFDLQAMSNELAPRVTSAGPNGKPVVLSVRAWRCSTRIVRVAARRMTSEIYTEYADPADPRVAWTLTRSKITWRLGGSHDATCATRYRIDEGGRITDIAVFTPLSGRRAATITVD